MGQDSEEPRKQSESEDGDPSRRNFFKWALGVGAVFVIAGISAVTKSLWTPGSGVLNTITTAQVSFPRVKVANISDLKLNEPVFFNYPLDNESNMIVKVGQKARGGVGPEGDIVAFSVICQHLGCIVGYQPQGGSPPCNSQYRASGPVGYCCCHASSYDLLDGAKVLGGPAPRPQPQVILQFEASTGNIYAVGMGPPTVFGHNTGSSDVLSDLQGGNPVS